MSITNPYKPADIKLESRKKLIWILSLIACGIYAIIVYILLFLVELPIWIKIGIIYSYMVIAPLSLYSLWMLFYVWKTRKWPQSEKIIKKKIHYVLLLLLIGICVVNWSAYWNSGIGEIWLIYALLIYDLTGDILLASVIYTIGATSITPALGEEFLKSLPSIIVFFVVLQRDRNSDNKRKGLLGNELGGFLFGMIIGIAFEILELMYYLLITFLSGGGTFFIYLQVTVRNWAPIHILGGAMGGFAVGRAERLRYERGEENLPMKVQIMKFIKRFVPLWLIPVSIHFLWNSSSVWLYLIILAVNGDALLFLILEIIVIVILSTLSFLLLLLMLRRANRIADRTYRCSETGITVSKEGNICSSFNDKSTNIPSDKGLIKKDELITKETENYCSNCNEISFVGAKFCVNCGYQIQSGIRCQNCNKTNKVNTRFCIYCGFKIEQFYTPQSSPRYHDKASMGLFIVSIILSTAFLVHVIFLSILILLVYGIFGVIYLVFQTSIELVAIGIMFYAIITLLKLRNNHDGRRNIWAWILFLFNLIGLFGMLLIYGIYGIVYGVVALQIGYIYIALIGIPLGIVLLVGASLLLIFLLKAISKSKMMLQYQRNF